MRRIGSKLDLKIGNFQKKRLLKYYWNIGSRELQFAIIFRKRNLSACVTASAVGQEDCDYLGKMATKNRIGSGIPTDNFYRDHAIVLDLMSAQYSGRQRSNLFQDVG
jgi:hypothetical protein